jgi:hypothetical protein
MHVTWEIDHPHEHWMTRLHMRYGSVRKPLSHISKYLVVRPMFMFQRKIGVS